MAAAAGLLVLAPSALADALTPESGGSSNADDIDTLYKVAFFMGLLVLAGVEGILLYTLIRYRAKRRQPPPAQIRGNTPLEIGWTAGAAAIVLALSVVTFVFLGDIKNPKRTGPGGLTTAERVQLASVDQPAPPGGRQLEIGVNGQQFLWRYDYPGKGQVFSYYEMVVSTHTTVTLNITSQDVIHSFWIPKLGGKADAVPGHNNQTWFKITKPGIYVGECAELCGQNHADHRARVRAVPPAEFERWLDQQARDIREAQEQLAITRREREREAQGEDDTEETDPRGVSPNPGTSG